MSEIERGDVVVASFDSRGLGIAHVKDIMFSLPYVLPGEKITYSKHVYRGKISYKLEQVLSRSDLRVTPSCKYFGKCGGCKLQHAAFDLYSNFKSSLYQSLLRFTDQSNVVSDLYSVSPRSRRRIELQFVIKNKKVFLGYNAFNSHSIISIDSCFVATEAISNILLPLQNFLSTIDENLKGVIYLVESHSGVAMAISFKSIIVQNRYLSQFSEFCKEYGIIQLYIHNQITEERRLIFQTQKPVIKFADVGDIQKIPTNQIEVEIDPFIFIQPSHISDIFLAKTLSDIIINNNLSDSFNNRLNIIDLFSGIGTLAIPLSKFGDVECYEISKGSNKFLSDAISTNNLNIKLNERNLFTEPLVKSEQQDCDLLVINPPRAGAFDQMKEIAKSDISHIIYVSCNPETLLRDMEILSKFGYKIKELIPFDQFLYSHHLEVIIYICKE